MAQTRLNCTRTMNPRRTCIGRGEALVREQDAKLAALKDRVRGNTYGSAEAAELVGCLGLSTKVVEALRHMRATGALSCPMEAVVDRIEESGKWSGYNIALMREACGSGGEAGPDEEEGKTCAPDPRLLSPPLLASQPTCAKSQRTTRAPSLAARAKEQEAKLAALKDEVRGNSYDSSEAAELLGRLSFSSKVVEALQFMAANDALSCPMEVVVARIEKSGKWDDGSIAWMRDTCGDDLQSCGAEEKQA